MKPNRHYTKKILWQVLSLTSAGFACAIFSGCVVAERRPRHVTVVEPQTPAPAVVVRETPHHEVVVVKVAPPAPRREIIVERDRPSPGHIWVTGYWAWRDRHHVWIAGHWELPPHERAVWVAPRWEHRGDGYVFVEGVWR